MFDKIYAQSNRDRDDFSPIIQFAAELFKDFGRGKGTVRAVSGKFRPRVHPPGIYVPVKLYPIIRGVSTHEAAESLNREIKAVLIKEGKFTERPYADGREEEKEGRAQSDGDRQILRVSYRKGHQKSARRHAG